MPPISLKRVLLAILIIVLLSKLNRIIAFGHSVYQAIYDSFEPLRNNSCVEGRYVATLLLLALIYITIFKLLQNRK